MKKYTLLCLLLIVLGQTPLTVEALATTSPRLKTHAPVVQASSRFQQTEKPESVADGYEADDEGKEKPKAIGGTPSKFKPAGRTVMAVGRLSPTKKSSPAPVSDAEEEESKEATSASPASAEEAKKATEEEKSKAIDDFLKDEQKVKNLLQKITDAISKNLTMKPISEAEVAKNPQVAAMKLQEVYSYYYSGFMSPDVQAGVETWIKDLLEKIDQTFITSAQQSVATAT